MPPAIFACKLLHIALLTALASNLVIRVVYHTIATSYFGQAPTYSPLGLLQWVMEPIGCLYFLLGLLLSKKPGFQAGFCVVCDLVMATFIFAACLASIVYNPSAYANIVANIRITRGLGLTINSLILTYYILYACVLILAFSVMIFEIWGAVGSKNPRAWTTPFPLLWSANSANQSFKLHSNDADWDPRFHPAPGRFGPSYDQSLQHHPSQPLYAPHHASRPNESNGGLGNSNNGSGYYPIPQYR